MRELPPLTEILSGPLGVQGTLDEARQQIMRELRYQSSLDLDEATYSAIRWVFGGSLNGGGSGAVSDHFHSWGMAVSRVAREYICRAFPTHHTKHCQALHASHTSTLNPASCFPPDT